jgi:hypothetical protein
VRLSDAPETCNTGHNQTLMPDCNVSNENVKP